jgi:hypothetical protein
VTREGLEDLPGLRVPECDDPVTAGGGEAGAVGAERHGVHLLRPQEGHDGLAIPRVPDPDRLVSAGGGEAGAVGAEGHRADHLSVALQDREHNARVRIREDHVVIFPARGEAGAVGAERHAPDRALMPLQAPVARATEPVKIVPLEAAEVGIAGRARAAFPKQLPGAEDVGVFPGALREVDPVDVELPRQDLRRLLGSAALPFGPGVGPAEQRGAGGQAEYRGHQQHADGDRRCAVATAPAGQSCRDRLAID